MPKTIVQYIDAITYSCGHMYEAINYRSTEDIQTTVPSQCGKCLTLHHNRVLDLGNSLIDGFLSDLSEEGRRAVEAYLGNMRDIAREEGSEDR